MKAIKVIPIVGLSGRERDIAMLINRILSGAERLVQGSWQAWIDERGCVKARGPEKDFSAAQEVALLIQQLGNTTAGVMETDTQVELHFFPEPQK